ncbi:MAG: fatty acid desaturase [Planctomycetes bacterium]|nr:fatty acid desaturase [Planctomycetota bacterium]
MSQEKRGRQIDWYRCPVERELLKQLSRRSDFKGFVQTLSHLGLMTVVFAGALYAAHLRLWLAVAPLVFLYGMFTAFMINGVHELGHGTVFRTKLFNELFNRVMAFLNWINFHHFYNSHTRHHAFTLHPPDDLEVTLPIKLFIWHAVKYGMVNPSHMRWAVTENVRLARGKFSGEWEATILPEDAVEKRRAVMNWSRFVLVGHGLIFVGSLAAGFLIDPMWFLVSLMVNFGGCYGGWLQWLCNNTQHVGLQDNVADFRMNCRTFLLSPLPRLLYWHMNYHTEHHMYPTVPCYHLGRLHAAIKHDMPPVSNGLVAVWREIMAILALQAKNPAYKHVALVPQPRNASAPSAGATQRG